MCIVAETLWEPAVELKPIPSEVEHAEALLEIERLRDPPEGSAKADWHQIV